MMSALGMRVPEVKHQTKKLESTDLSVRKKATLNHRQSLEEMWNPPNNSEEKELWALGVEVHLN